MKAPIYFRPARFRATYRMVVDIGLGGVRVYSDERLRTGTRLELDLLLPDGETVTCTAEVAWSEALPSGSPAAYDVGLRFLSVPAGTLEKVAQVLEPE